MRTTVIIVLAALWMTGCSKRAPEQPPDPLAVHLYRCPMDGTSFSLDSKRVLYRQAVGGEPALLVYEIDTRKSVPVVRSSTGFRTASFFPSDYRILYSKRPEGQLADHLFVRHPDGSVVDTTPWSGVQSVFYAWSPRKDSFYFGSNRENRSYLYLYRMAITTWSFSTVLQTQDMKFVAISQDERELALWKYLSPSASSIFSYNFEQKKLEKVAPRQNTAVSMPQFFSRTEPSLYYLSNEGSSRVQLVRFNAATGEYSTLPEPENIVYARQSPTGRYLALGFLRAGKAFVKLIDTTKGKSTEVFVEPGTVLDMSPDDRFVLLGEDVELQSEQIRIRNLATGETIKINPSV